MSAIALQDSASRKRLRKSRIREYFYGRTVSPTAIAYSPERREGVPISSYIFLKVGGIQLTQGMRIIGDSSHQDTCKLTRVVPSSDLAYNILGVLNPLEDENIAVQLESDTGTGNAIGEFSQNLLNANIAGFISVVQIDIENDKMTLLCPCPGALPSNVLLVGGIKWVE